MKMIRAVAVGVFLVFWASFALGQKVLEPWQVPCDEETIKPNLELKASSRLYGELKDASGAPFAESQVTLRKLDDKGKFVAYRTATTTKEGHFDLGTVELGRYRFLPGPNRGWKQPKEVQCWEGRDCEVKLVLQANPTDQEFCNCPIQ